jgi:hypothetical protein
MPPPAPPISRAESNVRLVSLIVIASARESAGACFPCDPGKSASRQATATAAAPSKPAQRSAPDCCPSA